MDIIVEIIPTSIHNSHTFREPLSGEMVYSQCSSSNARMKLSLSVLAYLKFRLTFFDLICFFAPNAWSYSCCIVMNSIQWYTSFVDMSVRQFYQCKRLDKKRSATTTERLTVVALKFWIGVEYFCGVTYAGIELNQKLRSTRNFCFDFKTNNEWFCALQNLINKISRIYWFICWFENVVVHNRCWRWITI